MWLFTKHGFFSVVCARQGDGRDRRSIDTDRLMVRARVRSHLDRLKERFPELLGTCEIVEFASTDYAHRIFVDKPIWAKVIAGLTDEIDYGNFKDEVKQHQGLSGKGYLHSLHDVWSVMNDLQKQSTRGGV